MQKTHREEVLLPATSFEKTKLWHGTKFCNDPTAGSPTVTLLRLLLPLNDQV